MKLYTTKIVAQYLDLSERRVRQLRDEGVLEEKAPGLYDLRSSVRRYINYLRGDEGGKADLNEERAKLTKEKRIAAETENKVRNGELYRKSDITVGIIYTIEPHERSPAYIAAVPCGMATSCTVKVPGRIKPREIGAKAYVAGAVGRSKMQVAVALPGAVEAKAVKARAFTAGTVERSHTAINIVIGGQTT